MLSPEQTANLKKQIIQQIENSLPPEQVGPAKAQVESMSPEQFEDFLKKNNFMQQGNQECVFCSIANGKMNSVKIAENENAVAVLELNPISLGHTLIIPKQHETENQPDLTEFAKEISEKLKNLNPKKIEVAESSMFGHRIVNLLPVYENETMNSERSKADPSLLESVREKILAEKTEPKEKEKVKEEMITDKNTWLPKRIP